MLTQSDALLLLVSPYLIVVQAKDLVGIGSDESKDSSISREEKWQEKSRVDKDNEHGRLAVTNPHKYHPTEKMLALSSETDPEGDQ